MRDILMHIFKSESNFESRLKNCKQIKLYPDEKEILFPPQGQCSFKNIDFSLAYKIFRNVCPTEIKASTVIKFGTHPPPNDRSLLASIERLRTIRNNDAHRTKAAIPHGEFEKSWEEINKEIENIERLLHLGTTHSEEMKKFKTINIDPRIAELERQVLLKEKELQDLKENGDKSNFGGNLEENGEKSNFSRILF